VIRKILESLDIRRPQVLIEAVVIDIQLSDGLSTGVDWLQRSMIGYRNTPMGRRSPVMAFSGRGGGGQRTPVDASTTPSFPGGGGLSYYLTFFELNLDMVIATRTVTIAGAELALGEVPVFDWFGRTEQKVFLDVILSWIRDAILVKAAVEDQRLVNIDRIGELKDFEAKFTFAELDEIYKEIIKAYQMLADNLNIKIALLIIKACLPAGREKICPK